MSIQPTPTEPFFKCFSAAMGWSFTNYCEQNVDFWIEEIKRKTKY